ncbi:M1 family metallopeptidase [Maribacter halichondriae]|uniref:M1 family metallopeptidase n=1 Tax=Maribacter halichondriae TaxID=2980554 RepID=UPI0023599E9E|nr:M1 family metallopeptidase [Maribacter sp. Hal144]
MKRLLLLVSLSISFLGIAQHQDKVDFIRGEVFVVPDPLEKAISGSVAYEFDVLKDVDSVFLDAKNMDFEKISLDDRSVKYSSTEKTITIYNNFEAGMKHRIAIEYHVQPKQTAYFLGWEDGIEGNEQIWTQGQGKYTSYWLPSFDDMEEKVEFDLTIAVKNEKTVIANGEYVYTSTTRNSEIDEWHFDMLQPMSSYLLAFAIGNYQKHELKSASGIPIENYYYPQDSLRVEPTYRYTKEIFDFLEIEIGVPYPWQNYKQIPVRDFLYAGMENTGTTIFSDGYVIDSTAFVDKNYVNVNAHELAHQWFGNLVTEKDGNHHWLHEGFATYYAYLAERHLFGDDHFYWKLYNSLDQLKDIVDRDEGQSLLDPKASSLTFYEKGAWALFMLRNEIGDSAFKIGIKSYLNKYSFKNVTIDNFLNEMETASGEDLTDFKEEWLKNKNFPFEKSKKQLADKSLSLKILSNIGADLKTAQSDDIDCKSYWDTTKSIHLKKHLLKNYHTSLPEQIYSKAFESDTIPIRQVFLSGRDLSRYLTKERLESLLEDESYITKENALIVLWQKYPEDQKKYLEQTKDVIGLPNKNVRLLWLTLAILTNDYDAKNTQTYFKELSGYTGKEYGWEIRMGAFQFVSEIGFTDESLKNLMNAAGHHSWQFKKYARNLLEKLLQDTDYKKRIQGLAKELKDDELRYINTKLKE